MDDAPAETELSELESEAVALFVRLVQLLGLPKSIGQIYGLIYISPRPLTMDDIVSRLGISLGSASQGLRQLRTLKAIRVTYIPGERKDHYLPETEFRKLFANFIEDQLSPHIEVGRDAIDHMTRLAESSSEADAIHYRARIDKLRRLHSIAGRLTPAIARFINF
ncbi:GbsR/MarR family transcriptional regulator [Cerasicoccus arenae]|uniref:HTH-type transcriptional regulator n=1 Tax=Cerasicoccus arenae TaxID=424488 RepID=A0A8J3GCN3_9BACT|nr:hypothetical protein [Cerasicoccus arenae]MBK1857504.1 hypothetical protein [Cerasicoccus arenae]GHB95401.1 hypothetical protein GCM10007047_08930 [Cerasicoccus arenae]